MREGEGCKFTEGSRAKPAKSPSHTNVDPWVAACTLAPHHPHMLH